MKATDIFTPGSLPTFTYYDRADLNLEFKLLETIETKGVISSVVGPSKSGKTVLCENVIGKRSSLFIAGGGITSEDIFWQRLRAKLRLPTSQTLGKSAHGGLSASAEAGGKVKIPFLAESTGQLQVGGQAGRSREKSEVYDGPNGVAMLEYLRDKRMTLVVDDFHYIERKTQMSLVQQFKEAAREGCTLVVISIPHRTDDAIRANPDLRGRVQSIDIPYWQPNELEAIAKLGFPLLKVSVQAFVVSRLVEESISSPQLMQALCLQLCRECGIEMSFETSQEVEIDETALKSTLRNTSNLTNAKSVFDVLLTGPKVRGSQRTMHTLRDGRSGDVYLVLLKAISSQEPRLTLPYSVIKDRVEDIVPENPPRGVSITGTLEQMDTLIKKQFPNDRVLEWDKERETLDITDPYFLYYMRWSDW